MANTCAYQIPLLPGGVNTVVEAGGPSASDTMNVAVTGNARVTQGADSTSGTVDQTGGGDIDYTGLELLNISSATGGSDLITTGHTPGEQMGELLRRLENDWIESGFTLDKDTLLNRAPSAQTEDPALPSG